MHNWPTTLLWPAPSTRVLLLSGLWEAGQWSAVLSVWASLTKTSSWDIFPHKIRYSLLLTLGELVILNPCFLVRNLAMWLALSYLTSEWMRLAQTQVSRYLDSFFPFLSWPCFHILDWLWFKNQNVAMQCQMYSEIVPSGNRPPHVWAGHFYLILGLTALAKCISSPGARETAKSSWVRTMGPWSQKTNLYYN